MFTSKIHIFGHFLLLKTLNCHIIETVRAFGLNPTLRARLKYQLSSGILVVEDYTQQNWWDYTQQNRDWAALENPQIDTLDPNFEKNTMITIKLDGVGPVDNRPSTDKPHHFVQKKKIK